MATLLDYGLDVHEFKPHSRTYVHFRTNNLRKVLEPHYPPSSALNIITNVLLQR